MGAQERFGFKARCVSSIHQPNFVVVHVRFRDHGGYEGDEGHEGRRTSDEPGRSYEKSRGVCGTKTKRSERRACRIDCHRNRGGEEDRKVRYPADLHAQVEAQTCCESSQKGNVREGTAGKSKTSQKGGQSFCCEGAQGLGLIDPRCRSAPSRRRTPLGWQSGGSATALFPKL